jgi:biotin transport system substrate-specific component
MVARLRRVGCRGITRLEREYGMKVGSLMAAVRAADLRGLSGLKSRSVLLGVGFVVIGVGALTAGAWLSVPFYPVPLTMQTLAVLLIGGLVGPRLGVATVASYLALGLAGAPVFHGGTGGVPVLVGPTGGYLVGFLPAVFLMGLAASRALAVHSSRSPIIREIALLAAGAVLAEIAIYALGVPWLAFAYTGGSLSQAVTVGAVPYLLGDLLKTAVAIGAIRMGTRALSRRELLPF